RFFPPLQGAGRIAEGSPWWGPPFRKHSPTRLRFAPQPMLRIGVLGTTNGGRPPMPPPTGEVKKRTFMLVLGIETTCDETAAAVVERPETGRGKILSNIVLSQISEHAAFGGVVPEIAARAHVESLDAVIAQAMGDAKRG